MGSARLGSDSRTHPAGQRAGFVCFFFNDTATTEIYTLSLHDAFAILTEAALSFLGLGTQPPTPSWGIMLAMGRGYLEQAPWLGAFPGLAIFLTVLGFNLLGDGIRDALDPRLKA